MGMLRWMGCNLMIWLTLIELYFRESGENGVSERLLKLGISEINDEMIQSQKKKELQEVRASSKVFSSI